VGLLKFAFLYKTSLLCFDCNTRHQHHNAKTLSRQTLRESERKIERVKDGERRRERESMRIYGKLHGRETPTIRLHIYSRLAH
jgi:hypothetical protein